MLYSAIQAILNQGPPRACILQARFARTETPKQCVLYITFWRRHVGSGVRPSPMYIRFILKFSFENLLAFKYHPRHRTFGVFILYQLARSRTSYPCPDAWLTVFIAVPVIIS